MRFLKFLFVLFIIFACLGYGLYEFGTQIASEKVVEVVAAEIENNGQLHQFKTLLEQDAEVKHYINEENAQTEQLPFTTKEEATKTIVQKVGLQTIQEYQSKWQQGLSEQDVQELLSKIEGKFSEEEILALKVIAYKELVKP